MNIADKELLLFPSVKSFLRWSYNRFVPLNAYFLGSHQSWAVSCIFGQKYLMTFLILKLKIHLSRHLRASYVYLFLLDNQAKYFLFLHSFCQIQLSSVLGFSIDVLLITCLEERVTLRLKYFRLKNNKLSWKLCRLHQISLSLIARSHKFNSYACDVHPKFAYIEAYENYLLSVLSGEALKFFLILYRT